MPKVVVTDAKGLVQSGGKGVTINSDVVVSGSTTFAGSVSGVVSTPNVTSFDDTAGASETYNCASNTRVFAYATAPTASWTVAGFTNVGLSNNQSTNVKVVFPAPSSDYNVTVHTLTVDGSAATICPSQQNGNKTMKVTKQKSSILSFDIVKNSSGNYFVFCAADTDGN